MGVPNSVWKVFKVPSFPGKTKSKMDHNSVKLFWIGAPKQNYKRNKTKIN
jgi:hypothetical protein